MKGWIPQSRVELRWGSVYDCEYDWSWRIRKLPTWDIWYVTAGRGWIRDDSSQTPISTGDCLMLRPGGSYSAGHDPEQPLDFTAIHFEFLDVRGARLELQPEDWPPFARRIDVPGFFRELLTRAIESYRDGDSTAASAWLQAALMEMSRQDSRNWPAGPLGDQARRIEEMCRRLRDHPERRVTIKQLASELFITPEHFSRLFRRFQGISPRAFITRNRLEAARKLLLTSGHSIGRISELLGYESSFYFSRQFKDLVGVSPSEFRKGERSGVVLKVSRRRHRSA